MKLCGQDISTHVLAPTRQLGEEQKKELVKILAQSENPLLRGVSERKLVEGKPRESVRL